MHVSECAHTQRWMKPKIKAHKGEFWEATGPIYIYICTYVLDVCGCARVAYMHVLARMHVYWWKSGGGVFVYI